MFRDRVQSTALTSEMANSYFSGKIPETSGALDATMTTSLRFLLHDKIPDGKTFTSSCAVKSLKNADQVRAVFEDALNTDYHLQIISVIGKSEIFSDIDAVADTYKTEPFNCEEPILFRQYFRKAFEARCFWLPKTRTSLIFVYGGFSSSGFHFLQAALPVALGWPYERDENGGFIVDEAVKAYSKAMASDDVDAYTAMVRKFADKLNFEEEYRAKIIKEFVIGGYKREKRSIDNEIRRLNNEMDAIIRRSREISQEIRDKRVRQIGLETIAKENAENNDFVRYVNANKNIRIKSGGAGSIVFEVFTYVREFDPRAFERMLKREGSIPHRAPSDAVLTTKEVITLSRAIFVDQDVKLRLCAKFSLGDSMESYGREACEFNDGTYIINPHLYAFNCNGTTRSTVNKCLANGDFIRAVDQCTLCTSNIEATDTPVVDKFYKYMYRNASGAKCIEFPDGTLRTMQEAAKFIMEEHADE